jgi:hypothetical protein
MPISSSIDYCMLVITGIDILKAIPLVTLFKQAGIDLNYDLILVM